MSGKGYRKVSIIEAVWRAHQTWYALTPKQREALADPKAGHPRVIARLRELHLIRNSARTPTAWGRTVLRFRPDRVRPS